MGSRRIAGIRFQVYSGEHDGAPVPHVHAKFSEGEVVLELVDRNVRFSEVHSKAIDSHVKSSDVRRAVRVAAENYDQLLALWKDTRS